jgi:uncharacterized membrane protein YjjB (DUF3815 family)
MATTANFLGAVVSGVLAQYFPRPLQVPFIVYLVALVPVLVLVRLTQETVAHPVLNL